MAQSLEKIKAPVALEMKEFETRFREAMKSKVALLDRITFYIAHRKGKQMRPMFVFLTAKMLGGINDSTYTAASLIELLHTATLVHDDVVDNSDERRGFFSINALWKNKIAVLVGDYFLSKGLLLALDNEEYHMLQILSKAVKSMSEGELLQMAKARRMNVDEEVYFEIIRQKTASLIGAACGVGAVSVTKESVLIERAQKLGETIGMAFQIRDDLFDYNDFEIGKPVGLDIKEKKLTLPLIYALNQASKSDRRRIIYLIKNASQKKKAVREIVSFVKEKKGDEYAVTQMQHFIDKTLALLNDFPSNEARAAFTELVRYVTERTK
jgi:octaprenyl-diphosphate synthase